MIKINNEDVKITRFPDGTPKIDLEMLNQPGTMEHLVLRGSAINYGIGVPSIMPVEIEWKFDSMEELFILQCVTEAVKSAGFEVILNMPYIPNARMDRVKAPSEIFTLKTFAKIINSMGFKRVYVVNAHSDVSLALIDNIEDRGQLAIHRFMLYKVNAGLDSNIHVDVIMFPDVGACKRYSSNDSIKNTYDLIVGEKNRDWKTGQILGLDIKSNVDLNGKDVLIIDDICSRGGTFKHSAIELKKRGVNNIYLYVSHCENVVDIDALKEAGIVKVFTTDSIWRGDSEFIEVIQ